MYGDRKFKTKHVGLIARAFNKAAGSGWLTHGPDYKLTVGIAAAGFQFRPRFLGKASMAALGSGRSFRQFSNTTEAWQLATSGCLESACRETDGIWQRSLLEDKELAAKATSLPLAAGREPQSALIVYINNECVAVKELQLIP